MYMCKIAFDQFYKWQLVDVLSRYSILALTFSSECSFFWLHPINTYYIALLLFNIYIDVFFPFSVAILNVPNRIDFLLFLVFYFGFGKIIFHSKIIAHWAMESFTLLLLNNILVWAIDGLQKRGFEFGPAIHKNGSANKYIRKITHFMHG